MASPFPFVAGQILTAAELNEIEPQLVPDIGLISAQYYSPPGLLNTNTQSVYGTQTFVPMYVPTTTTFDRIQMYSATTITNPTLFRLGIYNSSNGVPSTVLLDAGTVSVTAATTSYEITISQSIANGWYWLSACNQTVATTSNTVRIGFNSSMPLVTGAATTAGLRGTWASTGITGAFATYNPAVSTAATSGISVQLRKA